MQIRITLKVSLIGAIKNVYIIFVFAQKGQLASEMLFYQVRYIAQSITDFSYRICV